MRGKGDFTRYVWVVSRTDCNVAFEMGYRHSLSYFEHRFVLATFLCSASFLVGLVFGSRERCGELCDVQNGEKVMRGWCKKRRD